MPLLTGLELPPIEKLVPHRAPMFFIERVLEYTAESLSCSVAPSRNEVCAHFGAKLPLAFGVEFMAQCAAVYAGIQAFGQGCAVQPGFLMSARNVEILADCFPVNEELLVQVKLAQTTETASRFDCALYSGHTRSCLMRATLGIFHGS